MGLTKDKNTVINEYHLNRHQPDKPQLAILDLSHHIAKNQCHITQPHIHSFYQVIWFKSGNGRHFVDFNTYDVFENAFFFIAPNQVHYFDGNTAYEGVLIHFNEAFLVKNESEMDFFLKCSLFNNPSQQPSCCVGKGMEDILDEYILQIRREFENENVFGKELLLRNYLQSFLVQVQRSKNEPFDHLSELADDKRLQLIRFLNLVNENYKKGLSIAEYARLLHISPRSLSDLTHHLLNKTPSRIIQERIILEAQRMLLYANLNINQIGYRLGFDDASYFVKFFKKHTGNSPSEFRKSVS